MAKIKICGLKRLEDVEVANELNLDFVGFVFAGKKRKITFEKAAELRAALKPEIPAVGVFVNEPMENVFKLAEKHIIQAIQLHGDEGRDYMENLREGLSERLEGKMALIIKAIRVKNTTDILEGEKLPCDMLLLDTFEPVSEKEGGYGGTGKVFDHGMIPKLSKPYFLAGGLNSENIRAAVDKICPYAVDVSSGVETDEWKDREKMIQFVKALRE